MLTILLNIHILDVPPLYFITPTIYDALYFFTLSYAVFWTGIINMIFNYKNLLITMLNIELMYLGIVSGFAILAVLMNSVDGQLFALILLILAASESAIGLGILIIMFKYGRNIDFSTYQELRG